MKEIDTFNFIAIHCSKNVRAASDRHIANALLIEVNAPFLYWDSIRGMVGIVLSILKQFYACELDKPSFPVNAIEHA